MAVTCAGTVLLLLPASSARLRLRASPLLTCCDGCCVCARSDLQARALEPNVIALLSSERAGELLIGCVSHAALCSVAVRSVGDQERRRCACLLCCTRGRVYVCCAYGVSDRSVRRPTRPMWRPTGLLDGQTYRSIMFHDRVYGKTSYG